MAINFTDSPSNGATQTISGRTYTYNSAKNKWDTTATEVTGPSATVYANVNALPGTATTGDQAFVSSTNRLYIWNGSGWYNIALVNNTPTWTTQPSSSYALAIDGTATTITIVAADPEGFPITYSIVSDTSGSIATVTQGTGANANTFTITPSTSTADAGTFSLTFRASDGINVASAVSSFTLQFLVQNQRYTTALITSVGANNAVNNSFDDKSTSDHTITANGDIHQTTFSPYRHGGYSVYFDGSSDNLGFASLSAMNPNTYMSLECWVKLDDKNNANELIVGRDSGYWLMYDWPGLGVAQDKFGFGANFGGSWAGVSSTTSPESGVWYHVVGVREDTTYKIYVNGTLENTATYTSGITTGGVVGIGANTNQLGGSIKGHLADVRVVISANSSSLPYTSNFTPSTDRLTAITDTQLLACHLPYMQEGSTHGHTITMNGNVKIVPAGPHDKQEYSASSHGGSLHSDGSGDYLAVDASSDFDLGTSDFTIEGWVYPTAYGNANFLVGQNYFSSIVQINSGKLQFYSSPASAYIITAATDIPLNAWTHWAVVRNGNAWTIYLNGKSDATATNAADAGFDGTNPLHIMRWNNSNGTTVGNVADLRFVKGTAVYTSNFTPPTAPLTAVTNTKLLVQSTDAGIIDKSQSVKALTLNGDTKSSTTQSKYLSSSMYFDGNGDWIRTSDQEGSAYGTADFTVESWVYMTSAPSNYYYIWAQGSSTGGTNNFGIYYQSNVLKVWHNGGAAITGTNALSLNTWHHVALSREGTNLKLFLDGTQEGSTATNSSNITSSSTGLTIARWEEINDSGYWTGYISDFRITKGLARYTANFTPPSAALRG